MFSNLGFEVGDDGVAVLTLRVSDHTRNAFTPGLTADLGAALTFITERADVVGAVITSGKPHEFMSDPDLGSIGSSIDPAANSLAAVSRVLRQLETCGKPIAAAINGPALGVGFELCLACHHRVLSDDATSVVGLPDVQLGLLPAAGGTQRLPRLIGIEAALPLLLSGRSVPPEEALRLALVDQLRPDHLTLLGARQWVFSHAGAQQPWDRKGYRLPGGAGALAPHAYASFGLTLARVRRDTQDNYPAPLTILASVYEGTQLPIDLALAQDVRHHAQLLAGPVARNLIRTALHRQAHTRSNTNDACMQRLSQAYAEEGRALLEEGVSPALIANAALQAGFAASPLAGAPQSDGAPTSTASPQPSVAEVKRRLLSAPALAAVRCLDDGLVSAAAEADAGSVAQLGFPAWTGGALSYIDTVGPAAFVGQCDALARQHGPRFDVPRSLRERARQGHSFHTPPSPQ